MKPERLTRNEAIDILKRNYPSSCYTELCKAVDLAIEVLSEQTTGEWIDDCTCSICRWIHEDAKGFALLTNYNFCPNCGIPMRKGAKECT